MLHQKTLLLCTIAVAYVTADPVLSTNKTIVELAVATADLSTLVTALEAGGLVDTLSGAGPFTVFAPTNEAFAKLPPIVLQMLLEPKNMETLAKVLTYHVVAGAAVLSKDLTNNEIIKTVEGENVTAHVTAAGVKINDATVKTADVVASNGVIHIIDSVLLPADVPLPSVPTKNIVELASDITDLSTLVTALKAGELTTALSGKGPFTVFAPTNEAFGALPNGTLAHLLDPKNIKTLQSVLEYHVISGEAVRSFDLKSSQLVKTLEGQDVNITKRDGSVFVNNAKVTTADADTTNGVVHIIDQVLLPPSIVGVAVATADLSTLVTALKAGGLVDTLSGAGPFTVFAPTNEAFAKLPPIVLQMLLEPKNKETLAKVLTYHVVAGAAVLSKDLTNNEIIKTVEGENVTAHVTAAGVKINDATVKTADVVASNGVIHIIDSVLLPADVPLPSESSTGSSHTVLIVVICVIVGAVILCLGGAYFYHQKKKKAEALEQAEGYQPFRHDAENPVHAPSHANVN